MCSQRFFCRFFVNLIKKSLTIRFWKCSKINIKFFLRDLLSSAFYI